MPVQVISVILANRLAFSVFQSMDAYPPCDENELYESSCVDGIVKLEPLSSHEQDEVDPVSCVDDYRLEALPSVLCVTD